MTRITKDEVLEKIKGYWPDENPQGIMEILEEYGKESWEGGRSRVYPAILMLSEGNQDQLEGLVAMAKADYRDVLAYAEVPEEMKTGYMESREMPEEELKALRERDREQYLDWLDV